jgi:hypothetical protein
MIGAQKIPKTLFWTYHSLHLTRPSFRLIMVEGEARRIAW